MSHTDYLTVESVCKTEVLGYLIILFLLFIEKFHIFVEVQIYWCVNLVTPISLLSVISFTGVFSASDVILNYPAYNIVLCVITFCSLAHIYKHSA